MILGFLWEYSTAFSASELLPQVSPQPEFLPVSRNISLTGSISLAAKSFHIFLSLPHPCQLNSYCGLKLRLIYWEEKRCTIAQIRSSIDAFAISFPLSASAQPAKLSQSSLRSTLAEEETANPTTAQREECRKIPLACYLLENIQTWDVRGIRRANSTICQISCFLEMFLSSHFFAIAVHISSAVSNISQSAQSFLCRGRGRPAWLPGMWDSHCLSSSLYLPSRFLCVCSVVKHWPRS